jgi:putative peptidoglycan lipid II flippase
MISLMTMISRVFGLIRDMVIAHFFGAGAGADAFFVAFKIPNYLRRLFAEGGFSQAFVPVLSEYKSQKSREEIQTLINHVAGTLGLTLFVISLIGVIAAPILIMIFAPGFISNGGRYDLAVSMLMITFPYILFISLTALAGGILNTWGRFGVPAFTPVLLNVSLILCAIYLAPRLEEPIMALAWGVLIAGVVQLLFQVPFLLRLKLLPKPIPNRHFEGVKRIINLMIPALFAVSITQINLMVAMWIASFLQTGSISWLYYSERLMEFPQGVFGVALATVILPDLSRLYAEKSTEKFSQMLDWALRWVMLITIPATLGLMLLAGPLLTTLFQYGEFNARDVEMTTRSLIAYATGLSGFVLIKVFASGYFSRQDTKTPVKIGIVAVVSNIVLSLSLVMPLAHAGLALATSLASFINAGLLFYFLRKRNVYQIQKGWGLFLCRVIMACLLMSAALLYLVPPVEIWLHWNILNRAGYLGQWIVLGMVIYTGVLWLSGLRFRHMTLAS